MLDREPPRTPSSMPRQWFQGVYSSPAPRVSRTIEMGTCRAFADEEPLCPCCHNCLCSPVRHCKPVHKLGLLDLPDEVLETIGAECGTDLRSLALVNKKVNLLVQRPSLWKHAYESSYALSDDKLSEWGAEAMPDFLWKAGVIRSAAPWPAAA